MIAGVHLTLHLAFWYPMSNKGHPYRSKPVLKDCKTKNEAIILTITKIIIIAKSSLLKNHYYR